MISYHSYMYVTYLSQIVSDLATTYSSSHFTWIIPVPFPRMRERRQTSPQNWQIAWTRADRSIACNFASYRFCKRIPPYVTHCPRSAWDQLLSISLMMIPEEKLISSRGGKGIRTRLILCVSDCSSYEAQGQLRDFPHLITGVVHAQAAGRGRAKDFRLSRREHSLAYPPSPHGAHNRASPRARGIFHNAKAATRT
jgi:hypothetical protein